MTPPLPGYRIELVTLPNFFMTVKQRLILWFLFGAQFDV